MLCPPNGGEVTPLYGYLVYFGPYYRLVMIAAGAVISFIMRYIVVGVFAWLVPVFSNKHAHTSYRPDISIVSLKGPHQPGRKHSSSTNGATNGSAESCNTAGYISTDASADESDDNLYAKELRQRKSSFSRRKNSTSKQH